MVLTFVRIDSKVAISGKAFVNSKTLLLIGFEQMKVSYINEGLAIVWPEAMEDKTPYDVKQVVADMLAV